MAVTRASAIKEFHQQSRAHGGMRVASDFSFQIDAASISDGGSGDDTIDSMWLYTKSQFWPELTVGEGIEVPTPVGSGMWQPSQSKFHQQASITFQDSSDGMLNRFFAALTACRAIGSAQTATGRFNAWVYYGTPNAYVERRKIEHAFIVVDEPAEANWESRTEILTFNAMIYYHYYGETEFGGGNLCTLGQIQ